MLCAVWVVLGACAPATQPRPVAVPGNCEPLLLHAADVTTDDMSEADARRLLYCQNQHILRAEEEQAAYAKSAEDRQLFSSYLSVISTVLITAYFIATGL
jgi:hypothetical protein